jgi:hypothetical protein
LAAAAAGLAFIASALLLLLHLQLLSRPSRLARQQGLVAPSLSDEELDVSMEIVVVLLRPSFGNLGRVVGSFLNSALGPAPPRG